MIKKIDFDKILSKTYGEFSREIKVSHELSKKINEIIGAVNTSSQTNLGCYSCSRNGQLDPPDYFRSNKFIFCPYCGRKL